MDGMDDFEMKPITKGLGFHKKPVDLAAETKRQGLAEEVLPKPLPSAPANSCSEARARSTLGASLSRARSISQARTQPDARDRGQPHWIRP